MAGWPCRVEPDQLGRPLPDSIKAALSASFIGAALATTLPLGPCACATTWFPIGTQWSCCSYRNRGHALVLRMATKRLMRARPDRGSCRWAVQTR